MNQDERLERILSNIEMIQRACIAVAQQVNDLQRERRGATPDEAASSMYPRVELTVGDELTVSAFDAEIWEVLSEAGFNPGTRTAWVHVERLVRETYAIDGSPGDPYYFADLSTGFRDGTRDEQDVDLNAAQFSALSRFIRPEFYRNGEAV